MTLKLPDGDLELIAKYKSRALAFWTGGVPQSIQEDQSLLEIISRYQKALDVSTRLLDLRCYNQSDFRICMEAIQTVLEVKS